MALRFRRLPAFVSLVFGVVLLTIGAIDAESRSDRRANTRRTNAQIPTFNREVVRILQKNCQSCHRPGDIAPFSLTTYQQARPWARAIREQVLLRRMPPWKPSPGCGEFREVRGLTDADRATIAAWVDAGSPEGDASDLPPPRVFPDEWALGEPDHIVSMPEPYTPPVGGDIYRCFSVPVDLRSDRFVSSVEVRPGNRRIVHHVIAFLDPVGASEALDAADPGPGYTCFGGPGFSTSGILTAWAPGSRGSEEPDGVGIRLGRHSRVVLQLHYYPGATPESDATQIGLRFARTPVKKELNFYPLESRNFLIPAGAQRHEVSASFQNFLGAHLISIAPHMHLLGREISIEMTKPGGQPECLIRIDDWDFNWQSFYHFTNPVPAPAGAVIRLKSVYDNSASNPRNPSSPPQSVSYGERTTDEMALAIIGFTFDFQDLPVSNPSIESIEAAPDGTLVVEGRNIRDGAEIEIDGRIVRDTENADGDVLTLLSSHMWKVSAPPGQTVEVRILNPDGARSAAQNFTRAGTALGLAVVSAASFAGNRPSSADSIVAAFGAHLAGMTLVAGEVPLPTEMGGTHVRVNGVAAPLFFISPGQINFLIPPGTQNGAAVIEITAGDATLSRGEITIASTAPSLFTSNSSGAGAPAALRTVDGVTYSAVGNVDGTPNEIDTGDFLVLFGTGVRRASLSAMRITIGGVEAPVLFAGSQGAFVGLDQINTRVPAGVAGDVDLVLTAGDAAANTVKLKVR